MNKNYIETVPIETPNTRGYFMCSVDNRTNYFLFCFKRIVLARVYELNNRWYIWYEKPCYRTEIHSDKPFSEALKILERDFCQCVA